MARPAPDITGQRFGRWTVAGKAPATRQGRSASFAKCDCGTERTLPDTDLRNGRTLSCGCRRSEITSRARRTHGLKRTREYETWQRMIQRCENPRRDGAHRYSGRGISVCQEWRESFERFLSDMGPRPSNLHSIDRIDVHAGYGPLNCRWATIEEQARNKSNNVNLTLGDRAMTVAEWAREIGMSATALHDRLSRGWSEADALTVPPMKRGGRKAA